MRDYRPAGGDVAGDRGGGGDVERVDAGGHRDDRAAVGGLLPARREAVALASRGPGRPGRAPATASSTGTASARQRQRDRGEARRRERRQRVVPVRQPRPRQREHRSHGDLDRAAVERVGAPRRQQHGVEAERGARAEDRADVGVVDDVLEHQHGPGPGEDDVHRRQRPPRERRQRPAVHVEAGDLLGQRLRDHVAGRVGRGRARRPGRRASAVPSGTSAARSRPRPRVGRPSRPRRGTARARPRGACAARRRAGRGSRPAAGRRVGDLDEVSHVSTPRGGPPRRPRRPR